MIRGIAVAYTLILVAMLAPEGRSGDMPSQGADPQKGAVTAANGTRSGVPACARCHGFDGAGDGDGAFPKISGLSSAYLAKSLRDFASRRRLDPIMTSIARRMTSQERDDTAAYYASKPQVPTPARPVDERILARGRQLAKIGDAAKQVQACEGCHGAEGRGEPPLIPPLEGQYAEYITNQFGMWRKGFRRNDHNHQMTFLARRLGNKDVEAVAAYFEQMGASNRQEERPIHVAAK
jgi:cytochrome c553